MKKILTIALFVILAGMSVNALPAFAQGGSTSGGGSTSVKTDTIKVSKCYINTGGEMLLKASSSEATARIFAYRPDGSLIGEVQNGGGSRYGGTVMPYQSYDPIMVTFKSTTGGSIDAPTTPFQL